MPRNPKAQNHVMQFFNRGGIRGTLHQPSSITVPRTIWGREASTEILFKSTPVRVRSVRRNTFYICGRFFVTAPATNPLPHHEESAAF